MRASRLLIATGFAAGFAFVARPVRAQGSQSDIISQQGDALARSTSAQALVPPMPAVPPNTAPPIMPATTNAAAATLNAPPFTPAQVDTAPVAPPGGAPSLGTNAPPIAPGLPETAPDAALSTGHSRAILIAAGALIAVAMFLWDRRRKG
jgi:hypothetical protein